MSFKVMYRDMTPEDANFIYNSWLKSYRDSYAVQGVGNGLYYEYHHDLAKDLMVHSVENGGQLIACDPEDPSVIYGYVVYSRINSNPCIHYIYVKHPFRKFGLAQAFIDRVWKDKRNPCVFTHMTRQGKIIFNKLKDQGLEAVFNPYLPFQIQNTVRRMRELENEKN